MRYTSTVISGNRAVAFFYLDVDRLDWKFFCLANKTRLVQLCLYLRDLGVQWGDPSTDDPSDYMVRRKLKGQKITIAWQSDCVSESGTSSRPVTSIDGFYSLFSNVKQCFITGFGAFSSLHLAHCWTMKGHLCPSVAYSRVQEACKD